jgi:hypothetical protein
MTINPAARVAQAPKRTPCEKFADETPQQQAAHLDIARKYSRRKRSGGCPAIVAFRIRDLQTFVGDRYGATMPDDDSGLDDFIVLAQHVARLGDPHALRACAARWCPWLTDDAYAVIVAEINASPRRWTADSLARRIGLDDATRTRLGITTIGAIDCSKVQRSNRRRKRNNAAKRTGSHATSAERTKPWLTLGFSRRTYYRKLANGTFGTDSGTAALDSVLLRNQCHDGGPPRQRGSEARADDVGNKKLNTVPVDRVHIVKTSDAEPLKNLPLDAFERAVPRFVRPVRIGERLNS